MSLEKSITDELAKKVVKKSVDYIDIDALAKRLAPKVEKEIEKLVLEIWADYGSVADTIEEICQTKAFREKIRKAMMG